MATLDEASQVHPCAKWWIKADGCDIVSGLEESVRLEWNGDVDYGTSELQLLYSSYCHRLDLIEKLSSDDPLEDRRQLVLENLQREYVLSADINFIGEGETVSHVAVPDRIIPSRISSASPSLTCYSPIRVGLIRAI